jgi:hypothetical protein
MSFKRILPALVLLGGLVGVAACLAGIATAWVAGSRLREVSDVVFNGIDDCLATARALVLGGQRRAQTLQITTDDIRQGLEEWTRQEAAERLASEFDIDDKAERLGAGLQEVNHYMERAATTVESVRQGLAVASYIGASRDQTIVDELYEQITSLRIQLQHVTDTVDGIRKGAAQIAAGELLPEQLNSLARLALRAVASLGEIDVRFGRAAERLSAVQTSSQELNSKALRWIVAGQVGAVLVFVWLAAGQAALCAFSWSRRRRGHLLRPETKALSGSAKSLPSAGAGGGLS